MLCNSIKTNGCTQFVCKFVNEKLQKCHFQTFFMTEKIYKTTNEKNVNEKEKEMRKISRTKHLENK